MGENRRRHLCIIRECVCRSLSQLGDKKLIYLVLCVVLFCIIFNGFDCNNILIIDANAQFSAEPILGLLCIKKKKMEMIDI